MEEAFPRALPKISPSVGQVLMSVLHIRFLKHIIANNKNHAINYIIIVHIIANNENHAIDIIIPWKLV